jgi:serine O-acetyltransferase
MFDNLRKDRERYKELGKWYRQPGFWIVAIYRFGVWAHAFRNPVLRIALKIVYRLLKLPTNLYSVILWAGTEGARIGPGFFLVHPHNVMIGPFVEIGEGCSIYHDVTLGMGSAPGTPKIGNHVEIYCGARILGGVDIGDRTMIGANCVVTRNIPPDKVIVTAPIQIVPRSFSCDRKGSEIRVSAAAKKLPETL